MRTFFPPELEFIAFLRSESLGHDAFSPHDPIFSISCRGKSLQAYQQFPPARTLSICKSIATPIARVEPTSAEPFRKIPQRAFRERKPHVLRSPTFLCPGAAFACRNSPLVGLPTRPPFTRSTQFVKLRAQLDLGRELLQPSRAFSET